MTSPLITEERTKLLPCPFCGKRPYIERSGERGAGTMIHCITDGCVNPHVSYYGKGTAIEKWNTRAALQPAPGGEVLAFVEALTPSLETKLAYAGDFSFSITVPDEDGNDMMQSLTVPWTTIKDIMKAISARARTRAALTKGAV